MNAENSKSKESSNVKKELLKWGALLAVAGFLYTTGLHTEVIGTVQRAMLWTGLFNANPDAYIDGPYLTDEDYDFLLQTSDGEHVRLKSFKGSVIFVNVWASWCPPCIAEMPTIETLHRDLPDESDIRFLMLTVDQNREDAIRFMENGDFELPYHFPASPRPEHFRANKIPTTYVISREGQIVYTNEGLANYSSASFRNWLIELADQ